MSLRLAVLALLDIKPASGYGLLRRFQTSVGCFWQTTHQQLYKELHALHAEGLIDCKTVVQHDKPDKKVYTLNSAGQQALILLLQKPAQMPKIKDSFLLKLFAGQHLPKGQLLAELNQLQQQHQTQLDAYHLILDLYNSMPAEQQRTYIYPIQTLKWGIHLEKSWLFWAEQCKLDLLEMPDDLSAAAH